MSPSHRTTADASVRPVAARLADSIRNAMAVAAWLPVLMLSIACSRGSEGLEAEIGATGAPIATGTSAVASSKACKLFTRAEIAGDLDAAVGDGVNWGLASMGCEWSAGENNAVQAIVVPDPEYWENLARSEGGEALSGLGQEAFVAPWLGSFRAGALLPQGSVYVMSPRRDLSVALLRKAVERAPGL